MGRILVQHSSAAPKRWIQAVAGPQHDQAWSRLYRDSITSPANIFSVRAVASLHATFGGVGRSSLVQNTLAAVLVGSLGVYQVRRLTLEPPSLTTVTCASRVRSAHSFYISLPLGVQQRLMLLAPGPFPHLFPTTDTSSFAKPTGHHAPCPGASGPSSKE